MEDKVLSEYFELLRYESVGADPSHLRDCVSCASWLRKWLGALGFSAEDTAEAIGAEMEN